MGLVGDLVVRIVGDDAQFQGSLNKSEQKLRNFEKTAKKLGDSLTKVGKRMTMFVTLPIVAAGIASLKFAADLEKQTIAFETLLGSAERAKKLFDEIKEFAATTPFQMPDLVEGSKRLLAFGTQAEDIVQTMTNLGNAAMGDTQKLSSLVDAFGKVQARGKASMRELNMFMYAGVPIIAELAKNLGVAKEEIFKMSEQGKVSFTDVKRALESLTTGSGRMAGLIEKQSLSLSGLISTLKDNLSLLGAEIVQIIIPTIKEWTANAIKLLQRWREMDDSTKEMILRIAGLAAAIGPTIFIIGKLILIVRSLVLTYSALNAVMLANPLTAALLAATALVGGLGLLLVALRDQTSEMVRAARWQETLTDEMITYKEAVEDTKDAIEELSVAQIKAREREIKLTLRKLKSDQELLGRTMEREQQLIALEAELLELRKWTVIKTTEITEASVLYTRALETLAEDFRIINEQAILYGDEVDVLAEKKKKLTSVIDQLIEQGFAAESFEIQEILKLYGYLLIATEKQTEATEESIIIFDNYGRVIQQAEINLNNLAAMEEGRTGRLKAAQEAQVNYGATALEIVQATTQAHNERHALIAENIEREVSLEKEAADIIVDYRKAIMDASISMIGSISQISDNYYQGLLDNENLTDKERKRILRDQAKSAKAFNIFQAVINTARAIVEALPNIWLSALAGITGATQIAAIASTPLPKLAEGGVTPALLHPNEAILPLDNEEAMSRIANAIANVPAPSVNVGGNLFHISVNLGNKVLYDDIARATKDRRILIDAGAIV